MKIILEEKNACEHLLNEIENHKSRKTKPVRVEKASLSTLPSSLITEKHIERLLLRRVITRKKHI